MNSDEIFDAIEAIAAVSGKKDKQSLIAKYGQDETFLDVVVKTLDPFTTYGMRDVPARSSDATSGAVFDVDVWMMLSDMKDRVLTGNKARNAVQLALDRLSAKSAELLTRIIRGDLRAGFADSTVNKVFKGAIAEFPYMRCSLPKHVDLPNWDWERGVLSQEKADGMFVNIAREPGTVTLTSRQGTPIPQEHLGDLPEVMISLLIEGSQTHGELLVLGSDGEVLPREIGNGVLNSIAQGGAPEPGQTVICKVWDQIPLDAVKPKGRYKIPYIKRFVALGTYMVKNGTVEQLRLLSTISTKVVHSLEDAYKHYRKLLAQGKEGTILKKKTAIWGDYTSKEQCKLKLEVIVDLISTEIIEGRAGTKNEGRAGSIRCQSKCGKLVTDVAVKNESMRDDIDDDPDSFIGRIYPIVSNAIMTPSESDKPYSLFLPRLAEPAYRLDKTVADTLEQIQDQFENAIKGA